MVMELIEGETLAAHIEKGPIPLDQALRVATQIADALDRAHRAGVTHRDVKPQNIMLTRDGVKVLDFGLAKSSSSKPTPAESTLIAGLTGEGTIIGTPQYMAPEQFKGKEADARSDIWAFGAVLYEMVTGRKAFHGATYHSLVGAILAADPAPMAAKPLTPAWLERLVWRCLAKDPEDRWQSMRDIVLDLRTPPQEVVGARTSSVPLWYWIVMGAIAVALIFVGVLASRSPTLESRVVQFTIDAVSGSSFANINSASSVSPDGRFVVFSRLDSSKKTPLLWLRPIDSINAHALPGTDGGHSQFWSTDSRSIAFFADGKLKRITLEGGLPVTLCDARNPGPSGGTWNQRAVILFAGSDGIYRVSALGGVPARTTQTDAAKHETAHGFPQFLPDGRRFLYFIQSPDPGVQGVYAAALDEPQGRSRILSTDHKALYSPPLGNHPGYLLWLREQTLLAQPFDAAKLTLAGEPIPLAANISKSSTTTNVLAPSLAAFWLSDSGLLAYHTDAISSYRMLWMRRDGTEMQEAAAEDTFARFLRLSPDGKKAMVRQTDLSDRKSDLWLHDLVRRVMTRFTNDGKETGFAVWSPDGRSIAFSSERSGVVQIYRKDVASGGHAEQLTDGTEPNYVTSWSPDGRYLLATRVRGNIYEIWAVPAKKGGSGPIAQKPFLVERIDTYAGSAAFSPDGKWVAYHSRESGRNEIYVRPFTETSAGTTSKWQVSSRGGSFPKWRVDGSELFYQSVDEIEIVMAATVRVASGRLESDAPQELFRLGAGADYDIDADRQRFLVLAPGITGAAKTSPLTVVLNWQAELK